MSTGRSRQASLRAPRLPKLTRAERADINRRNRLVEEHLQWARGIAESVVRKLPTWFTVEDLIGPAEIGLIQAASRYDASKNDNFRAYAQQRVFGACIASIRRREYKERAHFELEDTHTFLGPGPDQTAQASITRRKMWERVGELPAPNARVLRMHYFADMTLVEIAAKMGCGESWVCRLHREGLAMLRARCADLKDLAA